MPSDLKHLSPERRRVEIRGRTREFVDAEIPVALAREFDERDEYPEVLLRKFGDTGLLAVNIPEEYGGLGGRAIDVMPIYEEISRRLPVLAWVIGNISLYGNDMIATCGHRAQKDRYLPRLAQGRLKLAFAITEPNAGSDAATIALRATPDDGGYKLNGSKMFITGAGVSDLVVTMARTGPHKYKGITAFLVDTRTPGYSTRAVEKLGYHGSNTCEVTYEDVRVPASDILGGEEYLNQGWSQMTTLLNEERLALSACALGIGQAVVDQTVEYARERFQFRSPNDRYQAIQHALVEMATDLEAARQLAYHAAALSERGVECLKETSMSKYFASETAKKIALRALDILGRDGATFEFDVQRFLRDVLVLCIGGGTTQIQKNIIAKTMGLAM